MTRLARHGEGKLKAQQHLQGLLLEPAPQTSLRQPEICPALLNELAVTQECRGLRRVPVRPFLTGNVLSYTTKWQCPCLGFALFGVFVAGRVNLDIDTQFSGQPRPRPLFAPFVQRAEIHLF